MNFKLLSGLFAAVVCFLTLANAAPPVNTGRILIGYRVTGKGEADAWKKNGNRPYWDQTKSSGRQIGAGLYMTDINAGWDIEGSDTRWCTVTANAGKFGELSKVWFPDMEITVDESPNPNPNPLEYKECGLDEYIRDTYGLQPRETLRVSQLTTITGERGVKQLLIPAEIVNDKNSGLDLRGMCSDNKETVEPKLPLDFDEWGILR